MRIHNMIERKNSLFNYVGKVGNISIYVDSYASDKYPIILGNYGSIFHTDYLINSFSAIDPISFEPITKFSRTFNFSYEPKKLAKIEIELNSLACFL